MLDRNRLKQTYHDLSDGLSDTSLSIIVFCMHTDALLAILQWQSTIHWWFPSQGDTNAESVLRHCDL